MQLIDFSRLFFMVFNFNLKLCFQFLSESHKVLGIEIMVLKVVFKGLKIAEVELTRWKREREQTKVTPFCVYVNRALFDKLEKSYRNAFVSNVRRKVFQSRERIYLFNDRKAVYTIVIENRSFMKWYIIKFKFIHFIRFN